MKEVFIGSSSEALAQAKTIAGVVGRVPGVGVRRWDEVFPPGLLTYEVLEREVRRVAGAVFLASPDDPSAIRGQNVRVPRANVVLELGFFSALLGREAIALCRYDEAELPTDLTGFTYIPMGPYDPASPTRLDGPPLDDLLDWLNSLPATAGGIPRAVPLHGYSGRWSVNGTFERWRQLDVRPPDAVAFKGYVDLQIPSTGQAGYGSILTTMTIQVGKYRAEVRITDTVTHVRCGADGSLSFESHGHSRERVDRFGGTLQETLGIADGVLDPVACEWSLRPEAAPRVLKGVNQMRSDEYVWDRARVSMTKLG